MSCFADQVIAEVSKREILWNKMHENYNTRYFVDRAWNDVANTLEKDKEEVKSKWRNLRDQFQRELRRVKLLPTGELGAYPGKWIYFEHLYFLKDVMLPGVLRRSKKRSRNVEEIDENDKECDEWTLHIKEDCSSPTFEQASYDDNDQEYLEVEHTSPEAVDIPEISLPDHCSERRKRKAAKSAYKIQNKNLKLEEFEFDVDDDMCFVKSLVPFMRKLKPMRKLIVRTEIQNLLIRELSCEKCRSGDQQPHCSCTS